MLFYTGLFIVSLVLVLVLLWFYRIIVTMTQTIFQTRLPSAKLAATAHLNEIKYGKNSKRASKAWGRKPHSTPANMARTHPARPGKSAPWGWPDNNSEKREHHTRATVTKRATLNSYSTRKNLEPETAGNLKKNARRQARNNRSDLSGQAYKPSQDAISTFAIDM